MATKETRGVMAYKDEKGGLNIHYPVTEAALTTYDPSKSGLPAENMQEAIDNLAKSSSGGIMPHITVVAPTGSTITISNGKTTLTPTEYNGVWEQNIPYFGTWTVASEIDGQPVTKKVEVVELTRYNVRISEFEATINVIAPAGATITCVGAGEVQSLISTGKDAITVYTAGTYTITRNKGGRIAERRVKISSAWTTTDLVLSMRYGYRKKKTEGNPSARIEYLYDAVGMTPAKMVFEEDRFDYGDWGDKWFVTKNIPVMLKNDRTVDYELDHNDHTRKFGSSEASDISNTAYNGNAMSAIPLCWFLRYEDADYEYEIVCEEQWDESYKAYAHTRADGSIEDYFYWSMFGGSGSAAKIRSLADQTAAAKLDTEQGIAGCKANGDGWYIHTWSKRECIRTLLVLMGKSTNTQAVFGNGNCQSGKEGSVLKTGTLKNKGQFWGSTANNQQVKVFYIERFWGDQFDRTAGIIANSGPIYYKMTPEGDGYRVTDVTGYINSGITLTGTTGGCINATKCGEFGCIPTTSSGSESTFECDLGAFNNSKLDYLLTGGGAASAPGLGGAFAFHASNSPEAAAFSYGCGLSADMPDKEVV